MILEWTLMPNSKQMENLINVKRAEKAANNAMNSLYFH